MNENDKLKIVINKLIDDPLLLGIISDIFDEKSLFPLNFRIEKLSNYIFYSGTELSMNPQDVELLKERSNKPLEVNKII